MSVQRDVKIDSRSSEPRRCLAESDLRPIASERSSERSCRSIGSSAGLMPGLLRPGRRGVFRVAKCFGSLPDQRIQIRESSFIHEFISDGPERY